MPGRLKITLTVIGLVFATAVVIVAAQMFVIVQSVKRGHYDQQPFQRILPEARMKFLFLGDSSAVGTGARTPQGSTAGYFGLDFPDAQIVNISRNGKKIRELLSELDSVPVGPYDLVVVQIGANDILRFTSYEQLERDLVLLLKRVKTWGRQVVILHSGNIGIAPIFSWPFDVILAQRSRDVRAMYMKQAKSHGAVYVDLFSERGNDLFLKDVDKYYSADGLHPSEEGYRFWYRRIRESLEQSGVRLD